ncbi:MAG: hypothetical protein RL303_1444 [Verrucomicrobiota bacterium]|jgi:hypothetical protein
MSNPLRVARAGKEIGVWPLAEVRSLLADGSLLGSDHYWLPGMAAWKTLAELPGPSRRLPFARPEQKEANFFDELMGRASARAGLTALWDLVAAAETEGEVSPEALASLDAAVGFDVRKRCRTETRAWYRQAVEAYLSDRYFAPEEQAGLAALGRTLGLTAEDTLALHGEAFASYFNIGFQTCLLRDTSPQEKGREIALLSQSVPLPEEKLAEIRKPALARYFDRRADAIARQDDGDEIMDPAETEALFAEAEQLGFALPEVLPVLTERLRSGHRVWSLYRAPLREVPCDLDLGSEGCFWTRQVDFAQNKRVTVRRSYGGFGTSIKIWGPIRYRTGSYDVERETEDQVVKVDTGTLVFTSKRVIFSGGLKSFNFKLGKVLDVTSYANAIVVDKDTGGDAIFFFPDGQAEAAVILRRLVKQAKA